ncbi:RBBP9/YdeN family alpha/beta hydrolase [Leifsonia sp. LS-T14]|uniref:RBBP9/YdeN family alpha/beta hydrolase n=1 Tax=unclassified Leifsonia TaxID=2663824 RepID=UPI0035A6BF5F
MTAKTATQDPIRTILLPGIGGSDERHWQTLWERGRSDIRRIAPASWDAPDFADWSDALDRAAGDRPSLLVAHSLGCLLAVRWAHRNPQRVAGLFLVAAPDPAAEVFPAQAESFAAGLDVRLERPGLLVTSDDDPYCSPRQSAVFAETWRIPRVSVGPHGHLNSASVLGDWGEGRNLLTAFTAGLGVGTPP